jgi:predicted transcriptional regulator
MMFESFIIAIFMSVTMEAHGQSDLELLDSADAQILLEDKGNPNQIDISELEEIDDLESLKEDVGEMIFDEDAEKAKVKELQELQRLKIEADKKSKAEQALLKKLEAGKAANSGSNDSESIVIKKDKEEIFDVGDVEKELLGLSKFIESKIPDKQWDEISTAAKVDKYVVQEGEWLWKISQRLFGSGFYYSKIWSLNPQITNPHEIEPGMTLVFTTGDSTSMPNVRVGSFKDDGSEVDTSSMGEDIDFTRFGDQAKPEWMDERKRLMDDGVYFMYASENTMDDIKQIAEQNLQSEYKKYEPVLPTIAIEEPGALYDDTGFDKTSRIAYDIKEGFFLNTFVTSNIVQDLGEVVGMQKENIFIQQFDRIYVKFDSSVKVKPGDMYSIYVPGGKVAHRVSDRKGYRYTIGAQIKAIRKINRKWECEVTELTGIVERKSRVTVYTPKIGRIVKTYNKRNIEAAVISSYNASAGGLSFGDVVYIDRGRADGVEMGTVFELYSFTDRGTQKRITPDPTYKIGELNVISLTDNFATALISESSGTINVGTIALTKTEEQMALEQSVKKENALTDVKKLETAALDELDVELNIDDINKDLLDRADQIQLSEDELEELERQERERSIIKEHEKDLRELEKLEREIVDAESSINEAKLDEDKFLEQQDLNKVEKGTKKSQADKWGSLNDLEEEIGVKFMDEDLNSKENPYGLTEFDLEEIDELLNTEEL